MSNKKGIIWTVTILFCCIAVIVIYKSRVSQISFDERLWKMETGGVWPTYRPRMRDDLLIRLECKKDWTQPVVLSVLGKPDQVLHDRQLLMYFMGSEPGLHMYLEDWQNLYLYFDGHGNLCSYRVGR